jgi:nicotinamide-nucleotide amidase
LNTQNLTDEMNDAAAGLVSLLKDADLHISTCESCTGGMIASTIVNVPGASDVFEEGLIAYSERIKMKEVGVRPETLKAHTVVSAEVAAEMAEGIREKSESGISLAVTGYAGPGDGEDGTPAGTVFIACSYGDSTVSEHFLFEGDRQDVRKKAALKALRMACRMVES